MRILAIDPGSEKSGWCVLVDGVPTRWDETPNDELLMMIADGEDLAYPNNYMLAIEYVYLRGMKVFQQAIDTVFWVGRFVECWGESYALIDRKDEKMVLCGNATANDASIRIALIDRFGGPDVAIGGKRCRTCAGKGWKGRGRPPCPDCAYDNSTGYETPPGPLKGLTGHAMSALAVGVTYLDQQGAST